MFYNSESVFAFLRASYKNKTFLSKKIKYLLSQKSYLFRFLHLMQKNLRKKLKKKEKNESNENNESDESEQPYI